MLIVFTGNGKGKTTASLGQMVRVTGRGGRALMIQFIKGPWKAGEDRFAKRLAIEESRFKIVKMGLGFVGILGDTLPRKDHEEAAAKALKYFEEELNKNTGEDGWNLIVLDEVNNAVALKLLSIESLLEAIKKVPDETIVVCTGRDADERLIEQAQLVTEMKEIKHPFNDGRWAKMNIEF